jgi:hypothetical protein
MLLAAGWFTSHSRRIAFPSLVTTTPPMGSSSILSIERGPRHVRTRSATVCRTRTDRQTQRERGAAGRHEQAQRGRTHAQTQGARTLAALMLSSCALRPWFLSVFCSTRTHEGIVAPARQRGPAAQREEGGWVGGGGAAARARPTYGGPAPAPAWLERRHGHVVRGKSPHGLLGRGVGLGKSPPLPRFCFCADGERPLWCYADAARARPCPPFPSALAHPYEQGWLPGAQVQLCT